ncbi:MAG: alkaline phosphatase family protein [Cyclobacteriaceae bacterium]|nr:alkaline phosphatase family protein [Cyclobacteriaceae bacterium]
MKKVFMLVAGLAAMAGAYARPETKPRLVVGIVVDQMRQEYLYRYESKFGSSGFNRLVKQGFMLKNAHYNYVPTETGPGHASVYTGTTPAIHGIVANDWYDRITKKEINCVNDDSQKAVGAERSGKVSPHRLLTTTLTDELKLATQKRAKVVGVSIKDRGAVLPAGHLADGAYWYDGASGNMITSTYYKTTLPEWVQKFNQRKLPDQYLAQEWNPLLPIEQYTEVGPDDSPYEWRWKGKEKATFPYKLSELRKDNGNYDLVGNTPWGNSLIAEMAKAAIAGEGLGKDEITDFLAVSFSSTDRIGHGTGPNSVELADTYLRLDKTLEDFFNYLDKEVGAGKYTVFLTADHGVADVAQYLKDNRIAAGYFRPAQLEALLNEYLQKYFPGKTIVEKVTTEQVYINQQAFEGDPRTTGIDLLIATDLITQYLQNTDGIAQVYPPAILRQASADETGIRGKVIRGFHAKRCGDIAFVLEPGWYAWGGVTGSTHGSAYTYDTHVPIVFYGAGVKRGASSQYHTITDIAPTLSVLLKIKFPSGATGQPVAELLD